MNYWLMKSEPVTYSIDALKRDGSTHWNGVRNYQARNFMQQMKVGDTILFYHSNCEPPGIAGLAKVAKAAYPDPSQFEKNGDYFDEKATKDKPRWFCPDIKFVQKFKELIPLEELRKIPALKDMLLLQRGSRLSVQPVTKTQFNAIEKLL